MTPQELKNSILQLAIQGKLVEQRPEEGTAEELYRQIQQEKQALIKAGKIKKEKPLPEITEDEIPFELPTTWKWIRHNQLYEIIGGSQPPKDHFKDTPLPNCVRLYQIRDYGEKPVPVYVDQNEVTKFTQKGDILLARYGASVGKVFWAENGAYNVALARVAHLYTGEHVDTRYLFYYYLAPLYQVHVKNNSRSAQAGFNKEDLDKLLFPLPPLAEQKRIVAKIEELLPYIDRYEKAWNRLEDFNKRFPADMQKSILQLAIQGKLTEQRPEEGTGEALYQQIQKEKQALIKAGKIKKEKSLPEITEDEIPFEIPENWKWVRIGDAFYTSSGTTPLSSKRDYYTNGKYNWVRTTDLNNGRLKSCEIQISEKAFQECNLEILPRESVCIAMYGGAGTIGKNAIIDFDTTINQSVCAIHPNGCCDMWYMLYYMQYQRPNWMHYASGTRKDPNINKIIIKSSLFPLPPLAEQKRIVAKLEELLPLCERLK